MPEAASRRRVNDHLLVEEADGTAVVTFNRPERLNALSTALLGDLRGVLERLSADARIRAVILTGAGRAFSAGGDRHEADAPWGGSPEEDAALLRGLMESSRLLHEMVKVTIAAVNGHCAGGALALACACDLRYASTGARFSTAFANVGLSGDFGGTATLSWVVGPAKARQLYLLAETIDADEALRIGLVSDVLEDGELLPQALHAARKAALAEPEALAGMKQNLNDALTCSLSEVLDREALRQVRSARSAGFAERFSLESPK